MTNNEQKIIDAINSLTAADLVSSLTPDEVRLLADQTTVLTSIIAKHRRWAHNLRDAKALARASYGQRLR